MTALDNPFTGHPATFVLIPGAGGKALYWHLVEPELRRRGHEVVSVELPAADESAGLATYTQTVVDAIGEHTEVVVVAQSLGGFTGPLVCERRPVELLVLLNAMIPQPAERGGEWWVNTGHAEARAEQARREGWVAPKPDEDLLDAFFHDVSPEVTATMTADGEPQQSGTPFAEPWPLSSWPDVTTRVLQGSDDRFFPVEFQRRIAKRRLGVDLDEMPGGHLLALSQPAALAERLVTYWADLRRVRAPMT